MPPVRHVTHVIGWQHEADDKADRAIKAVIDRDRIVQACGRQAAIYSKPAAVCWKEHFAVVKWLYAGPGD